MKENYTVNDPVSFSVTLEGYSTGCGDTMATITRENDSKYQSPGWASQPQCVAHASLHDFKFTALSANTSINQTGNYILTVSFDDLFEHQKTVKQKFSVFASKNTSIFDTEINSHNAQSLSENDCRQFYTVPEDNNFLEMYPVLVLQQNSMGCAKLTYKVSYMYNDTRTGSAWPQMANFTDIFHIGKYRYTSSGYSYGVSSIDTTHTFKIKSIPDVVDLAKYPVGSQFDVVLIMQPLSNATGFYDYSVEEIPCNSYPLAVGYSLDQVNSYDFSKGMVGMHNHSCFNGPYLISSVQVSGMDFKLIKFQ